MKEEDKNQQHQVKGSNAPLMQTQYIREQPEEEKGVSVK
jgi:hypothetical protein